jgi:hypothetical protein
LAVNGQDSAIQPEGGSLPYREIWPWLTLEELKAEAFAQLERRGYEVRGKTTTEIRQILRLRPTKPKSIASASSDGLHLDHGTAIQFGRIGCNRLKGCILLGFYGARRIVQFYFCRLLDKVSLKFLVRLNIL